MSRRSLFTSESVTEGHPDKVADQISDAILDAILTEDPAGRVACETLVTTGQVMIAGEISTRTYVDIPKVVRDTILRIGYDSADVGFDGNTCGVSVAIDEQSPDIAMGVDTAYESRTGSDTDPYAIQGAGDQGMMFGYATDETPSYMPMPIHLAHRMAQRLAAVRKSGDVSYLRPDGKTQVTVDYEDGVPKAVTAVVVSTQHRAEIDLETLLRPDIEEQVIQPLLPDDIDTSNLQVYVNPTGRFELGGPVADAGLTGRKIIVDTYGGMARHGGGAFSGKDPSKVDRSAAYAVRWVAKNIVAAGLARRAELQVAYAIGVASPVSLNLETFGTEQADPDAILRAVREVFDLRPAAIADALELRRPGYLDTAAYGHFGREGERFTWERTDRADALRDAVS
ncbi:methionine adenosyltransferase [Egicoccus halophilus]|uniref:S-adenosylmethionine synthase n=1 Tax=Egicoccus halophilus TaxID=1670830 RepID=A0A8J3AG47_9ACTN|nr:methionine adenosyltransferase [Egicoccus halophilus]GGI07449.1 S-adenosylmethionine synthase [Egicoccus halophilus]